MSDYKKDPIFEGFPTRLKKLSSFDKIEKQIFDVTVTNHTHKNMKEYVKCGDCQVNFKKRQKLIKKLGFSSYLQYVSWKKIMLFIKDKIKENA